MPIAGLADGIVQGRWYPAGASVKYIDSSDNRGAGSSIGNVLSDLPNGTRVKIEVY
ncbi:Rhs family protein [Pseudomonas sp. CFII68]|nr:Rhs family protein [Pseudomonas sp. CFII68]